MGKGLSKRRRQKNYELAKQAKTGVVPLPPPPSEIERKRRKHRKEEASVQGSASFRKMMAIKAVAESRQSQPPNKGWKSGEQAQRQNEGHAKESRAKRSKQQELPSATQPISSLMGSPDLKGQLEAEQQQARRAAPADEEGPFQKKTMKEKKKEFLKRRKQKKKGGGVEGTLEERLMVDDNRPAFGEQALQPIKVNLKRKHWAGTAEEKAKNRIKDVYQRQMEKATAQANAREREVQKAAIAESFKKARRHTGAGKPAAATPASLAALVKSRAEEAAAAATQ